MSTYAIADAINKLADNLKYAIDAKNQIEKEKLAFEKEKFEFEFNEQKSNEPDCEHEWYQHFIDFGKEKQYLVHICSKCSKATIKRI